MALRTRPACADQGQTGYRSEGPARHRVRALVAVGVLLVLAVVSCGADEGAEDQSPSSVLDRSTSRPNVATSGGETISSSSVPRTVNPASAEPVPPGSSAPTLPDGCSSADLTVSERVRLLLFVTIAPTGAGLAAGLKTGAGGIFLPAGSADLVARGAVNDAVDTAPRPPLVAVDEEGGRVQRLASVVGRLPTARDMARLGPAAIRKLARDHGEGLRSLGITMDFAPVLDVVDDDEIGGSGAIGDRSFSSDPAVVTESAGAFAAGLAEAGVIPTYKHFPGHGHASGDSHRGVVVTPPLDALGPDLEPYRQLLSADPQPVAVMVGHLVVPGLTNGEPATVSREAVTGLLRETYGFDGLIVTDDLSGMRGILDRYSTTEAAVRAVEAGVDMVLIPTSDAQRVARAIEAAVAGGRLSVAQLNASADRVLRSASSPRCG